MTLMIFAAFVTSLISALTGMTGGVVLLSLMTFALPVQMIIPIHGLVQLASNSFRIWFLRESLKSSILKKYVLAVPFGAATSVFLLRNYLSETWIYIFLIFVIAYSLFKPKKLPQIKVKDNTWIIIGFFCGALAILVGSVGPFLAIFYVRDDFSKEEIVSNKSFMQMTCHLIKIPSFHFIGFDYLKHMDLTVVMIIAALVGTRVGVFLLGKLDDKKFKFLFKLFLLIALLRLIYKVGTILIQG